MPHLFTFKTSLKCNNCIKAIEPNMNALQGIKTWKVDLTSRPATLQVECDNASAEDIIKVVQQAGYKIEVSN